MTQSGDVSPSPVPSTGSLLVTETLQTDDELVVTRALDDDGSLYESATSEAFGLERLANTIREHGAGMAESLQDAIVREVEQFSREGGADGRHQGRRCACRRYPQRPPSSSNEMAIAPRATAVRSRRTISLSRPRMFSSVRSPAS